MARAGKLWGFVLKLMALLALIGAFIAFMRMQEDSGLYDKLRNQGHVARALVESKNIEEIERKMAGIGRRSSGTTTTSEIQIVQFRFDADTKIPFADLASGKVKAADLPPPPAASGDPSKDWKLIGITRVSRAVYDKTRVGEELLVANVPWNTAGPVLVDEINAYTPAPYYPWIAGLLILAVVLFLLGRRVGRAG